MRINPASLKALREFGGHTQSSLSKTADVNQGYISKIEKSTRPVNTRPDTAKKLADALGVPLGAIVVPDEDAAA